MNKILKMGMNCNEMENWPISGVISARSRSRYVKSHSSYPPHSFSHLSFLREHKKTQNSFHNIYI